ncbi:minor histocompatibility antigen H13, putative [Ectocarpus siliculosus]|uniref:Minor histocompatibility antigen H13, putative n=1 Tax=Ectocarpus siliculosus TaxID=2880 RepID=D7FRJ3_ECTSI|nr:minor histocompatibility antigen H13, putative [Ectocarpus siliculosus]|eukprot:CBJ30784.1 minor histocompatibility antigen H13, putative [Ectocarpus siliculosus]
MMVSKPSAAEAKGETVDPAEVEAALVEEDKNVYLGLFALQLLPSLLIGYKLASFVYFGLLAVSTVYLGSKRMDIPDETRNPITAAQAFGAPFAASVSLFGVFALLKYTDISVGIAYQYLTTFLGVATSVSVLPPILRSVLPENVVNAPVSAPLDTVLAKAFPETWENDDQPLLDFAELAVLVSATTAAFVYVNPAVGLSAKFLIPNVFAWCIGMQSIGLISISTFPAAAILLTGLFCYDIFWVFGTEVMMTVATKIEAPVKFLFPSLTDPSKRYPFSVLGLGDIVIPATFCTLMRSFDIYLEGARQAEAAAARALLTEVANKNPIALWLDSILGTPVAQAGSGVSEASPKGIPPGGRLAAAGAAGAVGEAGGGRSYFDNSVAAYALGLGLCFTVNFVSKSGQPALLYLNPALLSSAILTAVLNGNGELGKLLAFGVGKDSKASEDDP